MESYVVALIVPPLRTPSEWTNFLKQARSIETRILTPAGAITGTHDASTAVEVIRCSRAPILGNRLGPSALLRPKETERYLRDVDAVVCVETFSSLTHDFVLAARKLGKPSIVVSWETIPKNIVFSFPPYSRFSRIVGKECSVIVATTRRAASAHLAIGMPPHKLVQIYPGVVCATNIAKSRIHKGEFLEILYIGRLYWWKGLIDLICSFSQLKKSNRSVRLTVAGSGPLLPQLQRMALKLGDTRILGQVSDQEAIQLRGQSDIFVYPSRIKRTLGLPRWEEQFGFSVVESMAFGLPCIVTDCGSLPEVVGDASLVVPQHSPHSLARAIVSLKSEEERLLLGTRARNRASAVFDDRQQGQKFEMVIKNAAADPSSR